VIRVLRAKQLEAREEQRRLHEELAALRMGIILQGEDSD